MWNFYSLPRLRVTKLIVIEIGFYLDDTQSIFQLDSFSQEALLNYKLSLDPKTYYTSFLTS